MFGGILIILFVDGIYGCAFGKTMTAHQSNSESLSHKDKFISRNPLISRSACSFPINVKTTDPYLQSFVIYVLTFTLS